MTAIWALAAQIIMISIAYPTACLAAAAFAAAAILGVDPAELGSSSWPQIVHLSVYVVSLAFGVMVSVFWPALVAVSVAEGFKLRGVVPYLVAGCLVGLVQALPLGEALGADGDALGTAAIQLSVASGAVGGLVYWAIAGRSAGHWMELRWFQERRWR